ncbi:hypothetical protein [Trinickia terrae]
MKASVAVCALAAIAVSGTAEARVFVGVGIGVPAYPYYPYPYPYYYPAPVVAVPADDPPTYVEQGQAAADGAPQQAAGTWYYCDAAKAYYPYVKQCAGGWRTVPATPPAPNQ